MSSLMYIPGPPGLVDPRIRILRLDTESSLSFPATVTEVVFGALSMQAYEATYGGTVTGLHRYRLTSNGETNLEGTGYIYLSNRGGAGIRDHGGDYSLNLLEQDSLDRIEAALAPIGESNHVSVGDAVTQGFNITGTHTDTHSIGGQSWVWGSNPIIEALYSVGAHRHVSFLTVRAAVTSAARPCIVSMWNYETSAFNVLFNINVTTLTTDFTIRIDAPYSDPETGDVRVQFDGDAFMNSGDALQIDHIQVRSLSTLGELGAIVGDYDRTVPESAH